MSNGFHEKRVITVWRINLSVAFYGNLTGRAVIVNQLTNNRHSCYGPSNKEVVQKMERGLLLAGDIGGTKTALAIFSPKAGIESPLAEATFVSAHYRSLEELVGDFLARYDFKAATACFGVAGPVVQGRAMVTNLAWVVDKKQLMAAFDFADVRLLNDLATIAYAVPNLKPADLFTLNEGVAIAGGSIAVVAPGTGLGEAFLAWDGARYIAHPSEGGHVDFAPTSELETGLLCYLRDRLPHVSYERVCSGKGLPNIYAYLKDSGYARESSRLADLLAGVDDPTPVIVEAALNSEAPGGLCVTALDIFVSILGNEAGNLALKVLATGGVYLGGGIPPRIISVLKNDGFMKAFKDKGRMSELLARLPVYVILNPKAALLGAAWCGLQEKEKFSNCSAAPHLRLF